MKKVFLYAYDQVNLGDDLFLYNIVNRYKNIKFYLLSSKVNKENFKYLNNLRVIDNENKLLIILGKLRSSFPLRVIYEIQKRCNALVYIGGSIFIEYPSWNNVIKWWNNQANNFLFYVIGANFGPYQSEEYRNSMNEVFSRMQDVCFRDQYSYNLFKNNKKVRYAPDILFSMPMPEVCSKKKKVFISVINCKDRISCSQKLAEHNNTYLKSIIRIINDYLENDYKIVLSGFCQKEGDYEIVDSIYRTINHKNISFINYDGKNVEEILKEISSSSYVIGTRFHSIVLAMVANKPFFPIIYSNKTLNMLNDLGYIGNLINIKEIEKIDFDFVNENLKNNYIVDIEEYRKEAEKHYLYLDKVLMEK